MRLVYLLLLFLFFAQNTARALYADVSAATFYNEDGPYVELYFYILGGSVTAVPAENGLVNGAVTSTVIIRKDGDIIKAEKFQLNAPVDSTLANFLDLRRYALPNGSYTIEIELTDSNDPENARTVNSPLKVGYFRDQIQLSDVQLLTDARSATEVENAFVRNGTYLEPLPFRFYHKNLNRLHLYTEVYHTTELLNEPFVLRYQIMDASTKDADPLLETYRRASPGEVVPQLMSFDISEVPSGNYQLVVSVMNRKKEVLTQKKVPFQRSNPTYIPETFAETGDVDLGMTFAGRLTEDELVYALKALKPLTLPRDGELVGYIIDQGDIRAKRNYLYAHFARTSPNDPETAYKKYMEVARAVDTQYGNGFGYGFETDRGMIFLRYGRPDDMIAEENDPYAPPYEIWVYYDFPVTQQANVKFLFYNPTLASNGHTLLHSTARNEVTNPRWEVVLYENAPDQIEGDNALEGTRMESGYLRNARRYWEDF